eukprot:8758176-Pyramimonas_sp.AAC.1
MQLLRAIVSLTGCNEHLSKSSALDTYNPPSRHLFGYTAPRRSRVKTVRSRTQFPPYIGVNVVKDFGVTLCQRPRLAINLPS